MYSEQYEEVLAVCDQVVKSYGVSEDPLPIKPVTDALIRKGLALFLQSWFVNEREFSLLLAYLARDVRWHLNSMATAD